MPERKNGMAGILNLTIAPKFEVEIATEKAKNTPNIIEKSTRGFVKREVMNDTGLLIRKNKVRERNIKFSSHETTITGFFASHIYGRKRPALTAWGNLDNIPDNVGS